MKKILILAASAVLMLSSCGTYTGSGAYTGGVLGSVLGSAIGGLSGGPRGSDLGTIVGMAGGAAVLGGLVAGPALLVMGLVAGSAAKKNLDKALTNRAEAIQIASQLQAAGIQCEAIRRRTYVFYNLLARLDTYFLPLIYKMEDIIATEGTDYRLYSVESKKVIASCASVAVSVKSVLDTPLLTDDGLLTASSESTATNIEGFLNKMRINH